MKYKVLNTSRSFGKVSDRAIRFLEKNNCQFIETSKAKPLKEKELIEELKGVDGLIVGIDKVTARVIEAADRLKVISKHGVGVDNIDIKKAINKGIVVTNTPSANVNAVAELTIGLIFSLIRGIVRADKALRERKWERVIGEEIDGSIIGIIGLGNIGKAVAKKAKGLGMKVLAYDVCQDEDFARKFEIKYVPLEELLQKSNIISLHLPLTSQTRHILNRENLKLISPNCYLINTARGELIDEEALFEMLQKGKIKGAALDVFGKEPPFESPFLFLDNVVVTPHIGAYTQKAIEKMDMMAAENVVYVLQGKEPISKVVV